MDSTRRESDWKPSNSLAKRKTYELYSALFPPYKLTRSHFLAFLYQFFDLTGRAIKVHLTPKYFFRSNKFLHLFETHCAFLPLFNPNLGFILAVKVTKSGHHLSHDRASKGYGSIPGLTSQTSLHACLQRLAMMQISLRHQTRNRPMPLTSTVVWQMKTRFCNFYNL